MARFKFIVTAHVGNDAMRICSREYDWNITDIANENPIYKMVKIFMPFTSTWELDDGEDETGTTYCQYVSYDKHNKDKYLLAVWVGVDEN